MWVMFGFHWPELVVFLLVALMIFGPKRLPEVGSALGRTLRDFRHGLKEVTEETGIGDIREQVREVHDTVRTIPREVEASMQAASAAATPEV
jgi:sec-independent protein translocase protein TatA